MTNISWQIPRDKIWNEITSNPQKFVDSTITLTENAFDDADNKWWLNAYKPSIDDDSIVISLETEESVIDSISCSSNETLLEAINNLLSQIE